MEARSKIEAKRVNVTEENRFIALKDLADSIQYGHTASAVESTTGPRFLRITDIQNGEVHWGDVPSCSIPREEIPRYRLEPGDLVFARTGATTGKSFLIRQCPEAVFASYLIRVRVSRELDSRYLAAFFQSPDYWTQIEAGKRGIGQPNVNGKTLGEIRIPVRPLPIQRRIVAEIEKQFTRLDAGIAALRNAQAKLKRYRASVLKAACEGRLVPTEAQVANKKQRGFETGEQLLKNILDERRRSFSGRGKYKEPAAAERVGSSDLPKGWVWSSLAQLATHITDGTHKTPTYVDLGIPFLSAKDISGFRMSFDKCRYIPRSEHEDLSKRCQVRRGNVLITKSGTIGRVAVVETDDEFSLFESVANVPVIDPLESKFIAIAAFVGISGAFGAANQKGVAVRHLHLEDLRRVPIPLPPLAEQKRIVAEVERRLSVVEELEAVVSANLQRAARLRQSILQKAFAGELTNPNRS